MRSAVISRLTVQIAVLQKDSDTIGQKNAQMKNNDNICIYGASALGGSRLDGPAPHKSR